MPKHPPQPGLRDSIRDLGFTAADQIYGWQLDRELRLVTCTDAAARAVGLDPESPHLAEHWATLDVRLKTPEPLAERQEQLRQVLATGEPRIEVLLMTLPGLRPGPSHMIITTSRLSTAAGPALLGVAHDLSDHGFAAFFGSSEALDAMPALVCAPDGRCLAATGGARRMSGLPSLSGTRIEDTPFRALAGGSRSAVAASKDQAIPVNQVAWVCLPAGLRCIVFTRVAMDSGGWLVMMQDITGIGPTLASPPEDLALAPNLEHPLKRQAYETLLDLVTGRSLEASAERLSVSVATIKKRRRALADSFGVERPAQVVERVLSTLTGCLVMADAMGQARKEAPPKPPGASGHGKT